ncbi:MAG: CoxE, partial [Solirubrobacterales bacterium]|nr:CoxE [Solirubrobacterales bacterium]
MGTSELLDAVNALAAVPWTAREDVGAALAATLAKSPEDRRVFDAVFDAFLTHRLVEGEALRQGSTEPGAAAAHGRVDLAELRARVQEALSGSRDDGELRDLARMAIAALGGQGEGNGAPGLDLQRIRRE